MRSALLALVVCAAMCATVAAIEAPATWQVTVDNAVDTDPSPKYSQIFLINGVRRPTLEAVVGQSYTYTLASGVAGHTFALSSDASSTTALAGTTVTPGGASYTWTPTAPGTFGYICTVTGHNNMGATITVRAASTPVTPVASSSSGGAAPITPAAGSICDFYTEKLGLGVRSDAAAEQKLVRAVVERAILGGGTSPKVTGLAFNPITVPYFNSQIKYRQNGATPDYVANADAREALVVKLIAFFGAPSALGCTASGFPQYTAPTGQNQYTIHQNMNITQSVFSAFNNEIAQSATSFGVTKTEVDAVGAVLASFGRNVMNGAPAATAICWRADAGADSCTCAPSMMGDACDTAKPLDSAAASASTSFVVLAMAALLALFAVRA